MGNKSTKAEQVSTPEPQALIIQLTLEIRNLAHRGWEDRPNAEFLFREIGKRAQQIAAQVFADPPLKDTAPLLAEVVTFLLHDGGPGSKDYDASKISECRRKLQSLARMKCARPGCDEGLPHLYDENCNGSTQGEGWVKVEERLPEGNDARVLVLRSNDYPKISIEWYQRRGHYDSGFFFAGEMDTNVTHWRALPSPPHRVGQ